MTARPLEQLALTHLNGIGPRLAQKFQQLGIHRVADLLFHLPLRYEDRTRVEPIGTATEGRTVQLEGRILSSKQQPGRRRSLRCVIGDDSGIINLRFYHFTPSLINTLTPGTRIRCYGQVRRGRNGLEIYHPEYRCLNEANRNLLPDRLTPVYPTTEGLQQPRLRSTVNQALELLTNSGGLPEYLPRSILERHSLLSLSESLLMAHNPPAASSRLWLETGTNPGQQRLAFEELVSHRLCMRRFKRFNEQQVAPVLTADGDLQCRLLKSLPFQLTAAQQQALQEIDHDLGTALPMLRLLQGDVGSGKTVVAALAALTAIGNGYQVALMAPTEILAEQHLLTFSSWLDPLGIEVGWLSGKIRSANRKSTLDALVTGRIQLVVGTHALFQQGVEYKRLGLVIIDEQHRFGVHQRLALREKGEMAQLNPHQLVMTATPIPRTLAMSAYADLDCSVINELPPGRTPVNTAVIASRRRDEVIGRIAVACARGRQAYWVCTLIEESEILQAQAAEAAAEQLGSMLPGLRLGLAHGRMKPEDRRAVMKAFSAGELQLLVATTVIEVGVDVPNASLMVIENPERLGMAQLHQLRGRVGRGAVRSHCILLYQPPLSNTGKQRLEVLRKSTDGFYIAEKDLELRGPGQVLGTRQTGLISFRVADLSRDAALLDAVKQAAEEIMTSYPELIDPLIERWIGDRQDFINV